MTAAGPASVVPLDRCPVVAEGDPAAAAAALAAAAGVPFGGGQDWRDAAADPRQVVLVAVTGGRLAGAARGVVAGGSADVLTVAVAPTSRRAGTGRLLVARLLEELAARGAREVLLEVRAGNAPALALYGAFGAQVVATRRRYYADGEDALLLRLVPADGGHRAGGEGPVGA